MKETLPAINPDKPFENCLFDRELYSEIVKIKIKQYPEGFVMSLNNGWGTGKTTFIKMLLADLKLSKFDYVYINAWENDYDTDPFIAILGEFKKASKSISTKQSFTKVVLKASKVGVKSIPSLLKHLGGKYLGDEIIDNLSNINEEFFLKQIDEVSNSNKNISNFKSQLQSYLSSRENHDNPLVIIVDELDRCRPDYSIKLLETVKHLFDIPNIAFILSIDKRQLCSAVKGFYGSDEINAEEYLKKFIDFEVSLPEPNIKKYIENKIKSYKITGIRYARFQIEEDEMEKRVYKAFILYFTKNNLPVREINKILTHLKLSCSGFWNNTYALPEVLVFVIFLKFTYNDVYENFKLKKAKLEDIIITIINDNNRYSIDEVDFSDIISTLIAYLVFWYKIDFDIFKKENYSILYNSDYKLSVVKIDEELKRFYEYSTKTNFFNIIDFFNPIYNKDE